MSLELQIYHAKLQATAKVWDDADERLTGAATSLGEADVALLGSRVAPAARAFVTTWAAEIRRLQKASSEHAEALRATSSSFRATDDESVQRAQTLMAWTQRDMTPTNPLGSHQ